MFVAAVCITVVALSAVAGVVVGGIWYAVWGRPGKGWKP